MHIVPTRRVSQNDKREKAGERDLVLQIQRHEMRYIAIEQPSVCVEKQWALHTSWIPLSVRMSSARYASAVVGYADDQGLRCPYVDTPPLPQISPPLICRRRSG
ncbi:hypothetical protein L210DRAFT_3579424 [Boletus edulis BED1]|uniref:Uncharacterized protein n=1 Tax=Boletus edulis BED1 TaxID=1328754 RepID=A0AAD4BCS7_BOLED|nr:hypothetical protein L210DRAFT_3579424 [Boletus edulis BED1]